MQIVHSLLEQIRNDYGSVVLILRPVCPDASRCISCPSGWESDAGANSCDPCPLGKYGSVAGVCSDCPKGRYNDDKGLLSCKGCREDTFGTKTGATAPGECLDCKVAFAPFTTTMGRIGVSDPATGCVCAGGYVVCTADDAAASFSDGAISYDCSGFASEGPGNGDCVSSNACTICCSTCAAECAAAGESSGCTGCEAGEQAAAVG